MLVIWKINQSFNNEHPAPFPVELPKRCIEATNARIVLDPFMGSGTTAVAAKMLGVKWIGIEISKKYCDMANKRLAEMGTPAVPSSHATDAVRMPVPFEEVEHD